MHHGSRQRVLTENCEAADARKVVHSRVQSVTQLQSMTRCEQASGDRVLRQPRSVDFHPPASEQS
eukprot:3400358-Rhodomonas_salina.1